MHEPSPLQKLTLSCNHTVIQHLDAKDEPAPTNEDTWRCRTLLVIQHPHRVAGRVETVSGLEMRHQSIFGRGHARLTLGVGVEIFCHVVML